MTISQLIDCLELAKQNWGDIPVHHQLSDTLDDAELDTDDLDIIPAGQDLVSVLPGKNPKDWQPNTLPTRLIISC